MSSIVLVTLAGLLTAVCWGAGDWLTPRSKAKLTPFQISFTVYLIGVIMYAVFFAGLSLHWPTATQAFRVAGASVLLTAGYLSFVKALTEGAVGIVVPLGATYPLLTLLLSIVFLSQSYKSLQVVAMLLIAAGAVMLAYEKNHRKIPLRQLHKATFFTLLAVSVWGLAYFILNPLVPKLQWQVLLFITEIVGLILAAITLVLAHRRGALEAFKKAVADRTLILAAVLLALGALTLYLAASRAGNLTIPSVLSSLSSLIAALLGATIDREKLGMLKRIGAVVAVGGIILLNLA